MNRKSFFILFTIIFAISTHNTSAQAQGSCDVHDRSCIVDNILQTATNIENQSWKDQTHREAAKTLAKDGNTDKAISLIDVMQNPDTKALTIRAIAMETANLGLNPEQQTALFQTLKEKATTINHAPSYAIALTYIAMAQAFAGDDIGAHQTAKSMKNNALRNKALGETAEIQAEMGKFKRAMESIASISSESFRNKAYSTTSKIFADNGHLEKSLDMATHITNPYKKTTALQYILNAQDKSTEESKERENRD